MASKSPRRREALLKDNAPLSQLSLALTDWDDLSLLASESERHASLSRLSVSRELSVFPQAPCRASPPRQRLHDTVSKEKLDFLFSYARKRRQEDESGLHPRPARRFCTTPLESDSTPSPPAGPSHAEGLLTDICLDEPPYVLPRPSSILPSIEPNDQAAPPLEHGKVAYTPAGMIGNEQYRDGEQYLDNVGAAATRTDIH